jgi:hypothetical protein
MEIISQAIWVQAARLIWLLAGSEGRCEGDGELQAGV